MDSTARPPSWLEAVLRALLRSDQVENVSGDLLEIYRDEKLPSLGPAGADRWYFRQVIWQFFRGYWPWVACSAAALAAHDVINTYRDASGAELIDVELLIPGVLASFFFVGLHGGWRHGRVQGGLAAAIGAYLVTWSFLKVWLMATWYPFAQIQKENVYWREAWQFSSGGNESFLHWIFWDNVGALIIAGLAMGALSVALGSLGGLLGSRFSPRAARRGS
jgi:hypothetical protein